MSAFMSQLFWRLQAGQPITVLMGLAMAGGLTPFARRDSIVIVRRFAMCFLS